MLGCKREQWIRGEPLKCSHTVFSLSFPLLNVPIKLNSYQTFFPPLLYVCILFYCAYASCTCVCLCVCVCMHISGYSMTDDTGKLGPYKCYLVTYDFPLYSLAMNKFYMYSISPIHVSTKYSLHP